MSALHPWMSHGSVQHNRVARAAFHCGTFPATCTMLWGWKTAGLSDTKNASLSRSHLSPRGSQTRLLGRAAPADPKHPVA